MLMEFKKALQVERFTLTASVLTCWLGFDQTGLANLPTSAFVAHIQPTYNSKAGYLSSMVPNSYNLY